MKVCRVATLVIVGMTLSAAATHAQKAVSGGGRGVVAVVPAAGFKINEAAPIEVTLVKNAPFTAQAVTEFTQTLEDGNRIDRRYQSSVARDSRGRTRREEEIALIGPFFTAANAGAPRLVTIVDADAGVTYTLDENQRVAFRSRRAGDKTLLELNKLVDSLKTKAIPVNGGGGRGAVVEIKKAEAALQKQSDGPAEQTATQDLGSRTMEGVRAQGTRTTTTIPTGAIGNARPIEIVSERWFSAELQMPVLITRRDPRTGETTYRLTNILRGEQQDGLFTVPAGYEVRDGNLKFKLLEVTKKLDAAAKP
jgi:hypothetical protein